MAVAPQVPSWGLEYWAGVPGGSQLLPVTHHHWRMHLAVVPSHVSP